MDEVVVVVGAMVLVIGFVGATEKCFGLYVGFAKRVVVVEQGPSLLQRASGDRCGFVYDLDDVG